MVLSLTCLVLQPLLLRPVQAAQITLLPGIIQVCKDSKAAVQQDSYIYRKEALCIVAMSLVLAA